LLPLQLLHCWLEEVVQLSAPAAQLAMAVHAVQTAPLTKKPGAQALSAQALNVQVPAVEFGTSNNTQSVGDQQKSPMCLTRTSAPLQVRQSEAAGPQQVAQLLSQAAQLPPRPPVLK
jgi:hypothetical protein